MKLGTTAGTRINPLTLVSSADDCYAEGLSMTFLSALWALPDASYCRLLILDPGLSAANRRIIKKEVQSVAARKTHSITWDWIPLELRSFEGLPPLRDGNLSTYARLFLAEITDADSAIWLDSDFLIFRNLLEIQPHLTRSALVAGCQDTGVRTVGRDHCLPELEDCTLPYLNAGLLWLNLTKMRDENFCANMRKFVYRHHKQLRFHDQTAINSFIGGSRQILPQKFNYLCAPWYRDNHAILSSLGHRNLHYLGGDKPWMTSQRLSCYSRNLAYHFTRALLLQQSCEAGLERTSSLVATERLPGNLGGLIRQLLLRENEKTEDRFQSLSELVLAHTGGFESQVRNSIERWYRQERPAQMTETITEPQSQLAQLDMRPLPL